MRRAFSLVEILVVIAILIVLTAIMFSILAKSRESGNEAACTTHLYQLAMAAAMYEQDHDGKLSSNLFSDVRSLNPYVKSSDIWYCKQDPFPKGANAQASRWFGGKVSYFPPVTILPGFMEALSSRDDNPGVFACLVHGQRLSQGAIPASAYPGYEGLVLTVRRDGAVSRRRPKERCYSDQSRGRLWWDFFTDADPPAAVVAELTAGGSVVPCK